MQGLPGPASSAPAPPSPNPCRYDACRAQRSRQGLQRCSSGLWPPPCTSGSLRPHPAPRWGTEVTRGLCAELPRGSGSDSAPSTGHLHPMTPPGVPHGLAPLPHAAVLPSGTLLNNSPPTPRLCSHSTGEVIREWVSRESWGHPPSPWGPPRWGGRRGALDPQPSRDRVSRRLDGPQRPEPSSRL